ncbi:class II glutamine amidotransferase [Nocardia tengchongensis]|uniref:Class II glutamine amidotransferase n=1 Tax=Nocardia tengchongensis TaxID=2055889 RepID=A0ABX8CMZ1_9NOCA|nr:class II glutamine amidotransferase [Nocardia tengchongensis]QVI19555.1 class II glutamine amidotransferase [Nocardia tengchongensis]
MCLLTYFPPGATSDLTALRNGARVNKDGHGFAVVTETSVLVGRGMDAEEVLDEFAVVRDRYPDGPALFHSRYATHGAVSIDNCHPFRLGRDQRTVLAHNGVLPRRVRPAPYDPRSDTRIAATTYLPHMPCGPLDTTQGRRGLESWLGTSKLVILTIDPAFAHNAYIFNESAGIWDSGIWYSNPGYRPEPEPELLRTHTWHYVCEHCGELDFSRRGRYCGGCGWCFLCANPFPHCDCAQRIATGVALRRNATR